jgi:hypothetical protein
MGWFSEKFERIKSMGFKGFACWIFAKFLFGVGLGLLIARYFPYEWILWGWGLIILSIIISLPALKAAFGKR